MRLPQLLLIASVVLTACVGKQPQAAIQPQSRPTVLGVAELAMGVPSPSAQVGVRAMSASLEPIDGITFTWKSTYNVTDAAGNRYLTTTFTVHNGRATELRNFTVIALARAGGIAGTAITRVTNFAGNDASQRAREVMPAAAMTTAGVVDTLNTGLQVLLPDESAALQAAALSAQPKPAIGTNDVVLDYGFVVKNAAGQHVVAAKQSGSLTFSFKVPATSDTSKDLYSFSMSFLLTTTSPTRVTETLEEQTGPNKVTSRRAAASAGETAVLAGTRLIDAGLKSACKPMVAFGSETVYLANGSETPVFDGFAITNLAGVPLANLNSVPSDARVTAFFKKTLFSQSPTQEGSLVLHGSLTGTHAGSTVAPSSIYSVSSGFLPGESVQVSVQPKVYQSCDAGTTVRTSGAASLTFTASVGLSPGSATFGNFASLKDSGSARALAVGDVDRDSRPDIVYVKAGETSGHVHVMRYDVKLGYHVFHKLLGITETVDPRGLALADLDSDGDLDIAVADTNSTASTVIRTFRNDGSLQFASNQEIEVMGLGGVWAHDLTGDGFQDLVALTPSSGNLVLLRNSSLGTFPDLQPIVTGTSRLANTVAFGNVDGVGGSDIMVSVAAAGSLPIVLRNVGYGSSFQPQTLQSFSTTDTITSLASSDFNNDGRADVVAGLAKGGMAIWLSSASGSYVVKSSNPYRQSLALRDLVTGDWDSDGDIDIAAAVSETISTDTYRHYAITVNEGGTSFTFNNPVLFRTDPVTDFRLGSADMDGDKDLDLVTSSSAVVGFVRGVP